MRMHAVMQIRPKMAAVLEKKVSYKSKSNHFKIIQQKKYFNYEFHVFQAHSRHPIENARRPKT